MSKAAVLAVCLAPLLVLCAGAEASPLCDRLYARLADMPEPTESAPLPGEFTGAISRQNIELRRARSEQRSLGCSSGSVTIVNGDNEEACADLDNRIAAITEDLDVLKARRAETLAGSQDDATRRRVLVALKTNRCEDQVDSGIVSASVSPSDATPDALDDPLIDPTPRRHRNIIADLPPIGSEETPLRGQHDQDLSEPGTYQPDLSAPNLHLLTQEGPLRTMCVRTCDGSFFPISANAGPADFDRDAEACSARCPGAQTELYYHPLTSETSEMVSASTGRPYLELPTAFAYKTGSPATRSQCGCRLPPQTAGTGPVSSPSLSRPNLSQPAISGHGIAAPSVVTITTPAQADAPSATTLTSPPTTGLGPANALGPANGLAPANGPATGQASPPQASVERPYDPKAKRVRQVGPSFLPTEESSIDLRHPAGPDTQPQQTN